jgi:hypothetical protein
MRSSCLFIRYGPTFIVKFPMTVESRRYYLAVIGAARYAMDNLIREETREWLSKMWQDRHGAFRALYERNVR